MKMTKTFMDIAKIVLWAESPVEDGKMARLSVSLRDGNPRFVVNTGAKGREGMINFPMQVIDAVTCMNVLKDVASGENGKLVTARSQGRVYKDDKMTNEIKEVAALHIGKTAEGIVFLSVTMEGKPKIVFPFKPNKWMVFQTKDKAPIPDSYLSEKLAISFADLVLDVCTKVVLRYTEEEYTNGTRTAVEISGNDSSGKPTGRKPATQASKFEDLDELTL